MSLHAQVGAEGFYARQGFLPEGERFFEAGIEHQSMRRVLGATATIAQGYLEQSGVDVASTMVDMIRLNRLFEMSLKVASTISNDLDARSINDIAGGR